MADKTIGDLQAVNIGDLPLAPDIYDSALVPVEFQGSAMRITGAQWKTYAQAAVAGSVQEASEYAAAAADAAKTAEDARDAVATLEVTAETLSPDKSATADTSLVDGKYVIALGLPKGATGDQGVSITKIERTEGDGAPGTADTYTITLTDDSKTTFQVYNGQDGTVAFESLTDEQRAELKGDAFTYEDFTEEQLAALTGPAGKDGATPVVVDFSQDPKGNISVSGKSSDIRKEVQDAFNNRHAIIGRLARPNADGYGANYLYSSYVIYDSFAAGVTFGFIRDGVEIKIPLATSGVGTWTSAAYITATAVDAKIEAAIGSAIGGSY